MIGNRDRIIEEIGAKGLNQYAREKGINPYYVSRYVNHGEKPANREIQAALGIKDKALEYTRERNARLKEIYNNKGWKSASEFNTALLNGEAELPRKEKQCF